MIIDGKKLLDLMRERDLTPEDVQEKTGVHICTVSDIINGRCKSHSQLRTIFRLTTGLGVEMPALLREE